MRCTIYLYTAYFISVLWLKVVIEILLILCTSPALFVVWLCGKLLLALRASAAPVEETKLIWLKMKELITENR